ncbi:hypothetical protein Vretimale_1310 [Volvox reticuliferus]|uniref:Uncharacterized protein n=1 Tax=Volvox reticuliferus TaxID=1737510 RepID=A0A8J4CMX8_9CHLO|nr:hypothetical protein Vretifemale_10699 [Volvox reticuliferus]GIL95229.1 hypothetical protein Vretimale_1310 [Volvox reticuliferus]
MMADEQAGPSGTGELVFTPGRAGKSLLRKSRSPIAAVLCADDAERSSARIFGSRRRKARAAPFASMTMDAAPVSSPSGPAKVPMFMLASAAETSCAAPTVNAPVWRVAAGNLAAGATAGCAVELALYPIDTIKTRLQAMIGGGGLKALLQSGGGKGLYAGVWGNLAGVAPASAIFMAFYEPTKKAVQAEVPADKQYLGPVVAGMVAGTASSLIRVPTEVVKQRLQTGEFIGAIKGIQTILGREGLRGLYAGYGAFMLRDLPFDAIEFVAYEQIKKAYSLTVKRELNPGETSLVGAFAGGFTGVITTPLDVLKTRLMTQGASGRYKNLFDATVTIARTEGLGAFMSGWQPRLIWISLGGFVFFPVLEAAKKFYAPK